TWRDLRPVLDEEVSRLPERYRVPVALCYLEGKTYEQAARQLGCPAGTLSARLARARALLRDRLSRRGLSLSGTLLASVWGERAASAAAPAGLVDTAVKTGLSGAAGAAAAGGGSAPAAAVNEKGEEELAVTEMP